MKLYYVPKDYAITIQVLHPPPGKEPSVPIEKWGG